MKKTTLSTMCLLLLFITSSVFAQNQGARTFWTPQIDEQSLLEISDNRSGSKVPIGPVLYSQIENPNLEYILSSVEVTDNTLLNSYGADDFSVPEGETWNLGMIRVKSFGFNGYDGIDGMNVIIMNDNNGSPGTVIQDIELTTGVDISTWVDEYTYGLVTLTLDAPVSLSAGTYWLSVRSIGTEVAMANWGFLFNESQVQKGNEWHWKNPSNDSGTGLIDWTNATNTVEKLAGLKYFPDLSFALYEAPLNNDLGITAFVSPVSGENLTASEKVIVSIENFGLNAQSNFDIQLKLNDGTWIKETVSTEIASGQTYNYTFRESVDLTAVKKHTLTAEVLLSTEENTSNTSLTQAVYNYGKIYVAQETLTITACEGSFTDPGGIAADYETGSGVVTIIPGTAGKIIRVDFPEFSIGGATFSVYNGKTTSNELLGVYNFSELNGKTIKAYNADGALTFAYEQSFWETGSGWVGFITCEDPLANDFAIERINTGAFNLFEQEKVNLIASIRNQGSTSQSKVVTFKTNGTVVGTVTSSVLAIGETEDVILEWNPIVKGLYTIEASIDTDEGTLEDNLLSIDKMVYQQGRLIESFEEERFPPLMWTQAVEEVFFRGNWEEMIWPSDGLFAAALNPYFEDTLITPKLEIKAGDTLSFYNASNGYNLGTLKILFSADKTGPWKLLETIQLKAGEIYTELDLTDCIGNNYIAFAGAGFFTIDGVKGPQIYFEQNDMFAFELKGVNTPILNKETNYQVSIKNLGKTAIISADYTVNLYGVEGNTETLLKSVAGVDLEHLDEAIINMPHTFTELKSLKIVAKVEFANDENANNDASNMLSVYVQKEGTENITAGTSSESSHLYPFTPGQLTSAGEVLFKSSELQKSGELHGLTMKYKNEFLVKDTLQIFIVETEAEELGMTVSSASNFKKVYDDVVVFEPGQNRNLYIPFIEPFLYSGKNIKLLFYWKYSDGQSALEFYVSPTSDVRINSIGSVYLYKEIDIYNQSVLNQEWTNREKLIPNVIFHTKTTECDAYVSGTVLDENDAPFSDVEISVDGFVNTVKTDAEGKYKMFSMPWGNVDITATKFAYYDSVQTATFTEANETVVDFKMKRLPNVGIMGRVVSNDYNTPVPNAVVTLTGYENYETITAEDGTFAMNNIYTLQEYELKITHTKMEDYIKTINVLSDTIKLGDVVVDEKETNAFNLLATVANQEVTLTWQKPYTHTETQLAPCDMETLGSDTYIGNSPGEDLQLGNLYKIETPGTLTSFTMKVIGNNGLVSNKEITIKIYNNERELVIESDPFLLPNEPQWITVNVPHLSFTENFYAMIHWKGLPETTPFLGFDFNDDNVAYVIQNGSSKWELLSDILPSYKGALRMAANVLVEGGKQNRTIESYTLHRASVKDVIANTNWALLAEGITETTFVDTEYATLDSGFHVYRLQTMYTNNAAQPLYSNSMAKDIYANLIFNVTTNNGASAVGAKVSLINKSGDDIHNYTEQVSAGKAEFTNVFKMAYDIAITLDDFETYTLDLNVLGDREFNVVLVENIITPANLQVEVNNDEKFAKITWGIGEPETLILDNGSIEGGITFDNGDVYVGNKFETNTKGYVASVDIYGVEHNEIAYEQTATVTLEIFNEAFTSIGVTEEFKIPSNEWINIPLNNLPYEGVFYAMIHMKNGATNYLAIESSNDKGYYYDEQAGLMDMAAASGKAGVFLIRSNILVTGTTTSKAATVVAKGTSIPSSKINTVNVKGQANIMERSAMSYNVYLNDMTTPLETNLTSRNYLFTDEFVTGGTQTAGVSAMYVTGESSIAQVDFDITYVNINEHNEVVIKVYPNPANHYINLEGVSNATLEIYAMSGEKVQSAEISSASQMINISSLNQGHYLIKIISNNKIAVKKLQIVK